MIDQIVRVAVFGNPALVDKDQARRHFFGKADFMSDDDHRHPFFGQILHDLQHFVAQLRIERGGRLVEQHHFRLHRQRAGNRHALLLAARQFRRVMVGALRQTDFGQQLARQLFRIGLLRAAYADRAEGDIFQRRQVREQIELLEHHAGFLADQPIVHFRIVGFQAVDDQIAAGDFFQLVDAAQQGGFAGAGRPDDHHHFAFVDLQIDVVQHLGLAKMLGDVFKFNHRIFILLSRRRSTKLSTRVIIR